MDVWYTDVGPDNRPPWFPTWDIPDPVDLDLFGLADGVYRPNDFATLFFNLVTKDKSLPEDVTDLDSLWDFRMNELGDAISNRFHNIWDVALTDVGDAVGNVISSNIGSTPILPILFMGLLLLLVAIN
jgi:hypothetical protein